MSTNLPKEKGLAAVIVILLLAILLGVVSYWYLNIRERPALPKASEEKTVLIKKSQDVPETEEVVEETAGFEEIIEDETTPEEISNEVLEELDQIILSLDEEEENLSDL